ncbi:multicopper oxidase [Amanita thiersii Skay4041]|uniref:Multicopper oxidase n=1 Tax=Amanita thiersii Skay4041 TaxID=703135 RepID=A0A2A9NJ04_9AGAR|nr:multicopper oxidase [Amanita thiersii Skay4041]
MRPSLSLWTLGLFLSSTQAAIGPSGGLYIANKQISPDGFARSTVLAGKTSDDLSFPGPVITGNKGDSFKLNVTDALTDPQMMRATSIHWHGIHVEKSPWADGASGVTQCPIIPGDSFLYQFTVPDQAGTYWYHSHYSLQYCDGLRGAFVIYDPDDPHRFLYDVDDESTIITLADWFHIPGSQVEPTASPNSTLINGQGRYPGGPNADLAIINVVPGKRYRFRLISMSCDPDYVFSIDGHTMWVIETDGVTVLPSEVDSIRIFAGQRYSFIFEANQPVNNYWIRALPNKGPRGFKNGINSAILRYAGAPTEEPTTTPMSHTPALKDTGLIPWSNPGAPGGHHPGGGDVTINLEFGFLPDLHKFTVNGVQYESPSVPVLLQILNGARSVKDITPQGVVYTLPRDKVIEVVMKNNAAGSPHPIHLHGHTFDVIQGAGETTYNFINPIRRDVVSGGKVGDTVIIRFTTDNAGPWILHCHIDRHMEHGFAVIFVEDTPTLADETVPPAWKELCPRFANFSGDSEQTMGM